MSDWQYAQTDTKEQLAQLHYFSMKKLQDGAEIDMVITVKETFTPAMGVLQFFAQADKQTIKKRPPTNLLAGEAQCWKRWEPAYAKSTASRISLSAQLSLNFNRRAFPRQAGRWKFPLRLLKNRFQLFIGMIRIVMKQDQMLH